MKGVRAVSILLMVILTASPLAADVISTRAAEKDRSADAKKVTVRLQNLGLSNPQAAGRVSSMTKDTLVYYAGNPSALQIVGQSGPGDGSDFFAPGSYNMWYETAIGVGALAAAIGAIAYMVKNGG